ncbi:MAG: sigma-70 family RNA polymerase sigma factor, partial [Bacteroidales bacterium]|nr:sigma-70 family RNA polymerase sigma factor [Bacteroidales bacterium]
MQENVFKNTILPLKDKLFRFSLRILNNASEAEDIVQDAMLKVWRKRDEWDKIDNIEGYCYQTVKNLVWDRIQSKDYQNESYELQLHDSPEEQNPHSKLVNDEQIRLIHELIATLPAAQKVVSWCQTEYFAYIVLP